MSFILLVYVLLQILYDVGWSKAGASEISDTSGLFVKLNTRIDGQRKRMEKIMNDLTQAKEPVPAFMATLSQEPLTVSPGQTVVFPDVQVNVNGVYNANTGVFKAPTSGTYHFALTLSSVDKTYSKFYADMIAGNGNTIICSVEYVGDKVPQMRTISTQVALNAGEHVWVKSGNVPMKFAPGIDSIFTGFRVNNR